METLLQEAARYVGLVIEAIAILVVVIGVVDALLGIARARAGSDHAMRAVWLRFARWLVAGLTFQLASDIVQTTVSPTWDAIGRLAAVAAIRTFLTYFLDRDIDSVLALEPGPSRAKEASDA